MDAVLKAILEPLEQDHLAQTDISSINTFRNSRAEQPQPSPNVGLPGHLIQCHHAHPAYTTDTAPVVKMFMEQDVRRRAMDMELSPASPRAGTAPVSPTPSRGSSCEGVKGSRENSVAGSSLPLPSVCYRVIFARKPPSCVAPCSSRVCSSKKE